MIYNGNINDIPDFFNMANNHHRFLKFTHEISQTAITFLDVNIYKGKRFSNDSILDMKTYFKPTKLISLSASKQLSQLTCLFGSHKG